MEQFNNDIFHVAESDHLEILSRVSGVSENSLINRGLQVSVWCWGLFSWTISVMGPPLRDISITALIIDKNETFFLLQTPRVIAVTEENTNKAGTLVVCRDTPVSKNPRPLIHQAQTSPQHICLLILQYCDHCLH